MGFPRHRHALHFAYCSKSDATHLKPSSVGGQGAVREDRKAPSDDVISFSSLPNELSSACPSRSSRAILNRPSSPKSPYKTVPSAKRLSLLSIV